ncbi:DUF547 domain-containing protein [Alteromonas sp. C1M14]|uniref:DUF547 domain-containing protein n=1 Tax=Alteromonas sp. C1M14 TaxID=2841567 RepID=UPI001C08AD87|nr:DUF547 domain-containing protein [Alteromonas sp. C1M14]MBU2979643.1 DUF547 domain-containing protein [Alteromonas sp. C1M14]
MKTLRLLVVSLCLVGSNPTFADEKKIPSPFRGDDDSANLEVTYDDLDVFLQSQVLDVGRSTREKVPRTQNTGSRIKARVNRLTALEGNRFYFKSLQDDEVSGILTTLQDSLEALPSVVPLKYLSRNEQLAYWLNLYNFTLLDEMAKASPSGSIKRLLNYGNSDSILAKKSLNVAGIPLSLDDIQFTILKEKYPQNPLVIYGLFQGNIGGPSIQPKAFTGENVWRQLEQAATEFVNSNRGTYYDGKVSVFYERNFVFFDNDAQKLKDHLLDFLEDEMYTEILDADELKFANKDWQLANLTGGTREYGGSNMINGSAILDAVRASQPNGDGGMSSVENSLGESISEKVRLGARFPATQLETLQRIREIQAINAGKVVITDLDAEAAQEAIDKKEKN